MASPHILLVGYGNMGKALADGWLAHGAVTLSIVDPNSHGAYASVHELPSHPVPDVIVFAVKPQVLPAIIGDYKNFTKALILSIAAGITLQELTRHLPENAIIRAMPNLPVLIHQGITAMVANARCTSEQQRHASELLSTVGDVLWLEHEEHMDAVTAVSGSGPAYVFAFLNALIKAGVEAGLSDTVARHLATRTFEGSLTLSIGRDLPALINQVKSPNGTTEAALNEWEKRNGDALLKAMVNAAKQRSIDLSQ
jgi:pyrroline-5-carboxylate reductase